MKKARLAIILILFIALAAAGGWYYYSNNTTTNTTGPLSASGTVETTEISIAPEIAGKILELNVNEGDVVKKGDELFTLDSTLLQAQRSVAQTARDVAQAALETAQSSADTTIQAAAMELLQAQQALKDLNENADQARAQAQKNLADAQKALKDAQDDRYRKNLARVTQPTIDQTQADLIIAKDKLKDEQENYDKYANRPEDDVQRAQAFSKLAAAQQKVDQIQYNLDWLIGLPDTIEIAQADAAIAVGQANVAAAQRKFDLLKNGEPDPDALALAQARVQTAQVQLAASQAKPAVNQAAQAVKQAEANIALIDAQIAKTIITSPVDGVVLNRPGEPGSVVNPGGTVLTLGRLDELTITVYVPEDRMGEVILGQTAKVTVDTFRSETFTATVTFISDQAEFTPRNVQTVEGRKNTVFAVKLKLGDTSGKLKPGMPADVTFGAK
jgi:multidrug efflux pump subunit AcrA (membrane-fusion protein)